MHLLTEYLLKVIICSGVLTAYYWLALRNRIFHQWNRFYLLVAVLLSLTLPLVKFQIGYTTETSTANSYKVLETITTSETWFEAEQQPVYEKPELITPERISTLFYILVSLSILAGFISAFFQIYSLFKKYRHWKTGELVFIDTDAKGTPFSFFNYIFWNSNIAFESEQGQQIFAHELVHIKEKHSLDKLLINLLLVVLWINPFFWLIRKELSMIHEFIADKKAVQNQDSAVLAAMILTAAFPGHQLALTNPFFHSPIKRRLLMLSKLKNPKASYFSRLLLLPLLSILVTAFTIKINRAEKNVLNVATLDKPLTVVIDAGHGNINGKPTGAKGLNGLYEDDVALAIVQKIKELNNDPNLQLIFTRSTEEFIASQERVRFTKEAKADLFVSIHANYAPPVKTGQKFKANDANGFEIYVSRDESAGAAYQANSKLLAQSILTETKDIMAIRQPAIKQRQQGIWVLNEAPCPSVLLQVGFISHAEDAAFLKDEKNLEKLAASILNGIANYTKTNSRNISNTGNKLFTDENTGQQKSVISIEGLINSGIIKPDSSTNKMLYIINGKRFYPANNSYQIVTGSRIEIIEKDNSNAIKKYGPEAKNGVVIIDDASFEKQPSYDTVKLTEGVSEELLSEYNRIIDKYGSSDIKPLTKLHTSISPEDKKRLLYIFLKMNKHQQSRQKVGFIKAPPPLNKKIPSEEDIRRWKNDKVYGVWINDKRVKNEVLNKYKANDFSHFFSSRLERNAVNYGKHYVQIDLMTNEYFRTYLNAEKKNKKDEYVMFVVYKKLQTDKPQ